MGPNGLFLGLWKGSKTVLGSTHVVEQLSFSMLPSILTFDFDSILVPFLTCWGPNWLFLGLGWGSTIVLRSNHVVEQLFFFKVPSILTFDFDLNFGSVLTFWALTGYFWAWVRVQKCFGFYSCS